MWRSVRHRLIVNKRRYVPCRPLPLDVGFVFITSVTRPFDGSAAALVNHLCLKQQIFSTPLLKLILYHLNVIFRLKKYQCPVFMWQWLCIKDRFLRKSSNMSRILGSFHRNASTCYTNQRELLLDENEVWLKRKSENKFRSRWINIIIFVTFYLWWI